MCLTIFGSLNSASFIKFKLDNIDLINNICNILKKALETNNNLLDGEMILNASNTINHLNRYKIINESVKSDLNKLNAYDYYTKFNFEKKENENKQGNLNIININNENNVKNKKSKLKEKYKNLMKKKGNEFMEKMKGEIDKNDSLEKEDKEDKDNIMCFYCRNPITLKSFENPYGKLSFILGDLFKKFSQKFSIKSELNKITEKNIEEKDRIYSNMILDKMKDLSPRILTCGHYFHKKCFEQGLERGVFRCPICEKGGNILIPPLPIFYRENKNLFSLNLNLNDILDLKYELNKSENNQEINTFEESFKEFCVSFLQENIRKHLNPEEKIGDYNSIIDLIFINYDSYLNHLGNIFYCKGTTFYKKQQIDNINSLILSLKYLTKIGYIDINTIIDYIRKNINILIKGPKENDNIMNNFIEGYYSILIDKLILTFLILLDYQEIQKLFLYIINWIIPYFSFWLYLRDLIVQNNFYSLYEKQSKERINIENFKLFFRNNNKKVCKNLKFLLQKLLIIKIISNHDNIDNLYNNMKDLTIKDLFNELNISNLYKNTSKNEDNEINFVELLEKISQSLAENSFIIKEYIILDSYKIINLLINNLINLKEEKYLMKAELFSQFRIYKFKLIKLEKNIYDFIEKHLFEKCENCTKVENSCFICLICGSKICHNGNCKKIASHKFRCIGNYSFMIEFKTTRLYCLSNIYLKKFHFLYSDKSGNGPKQNISKYYYLDKEKYKSALRDYICLQYYLI